MPLENIENGVLHKRLLANIIVFPFVKTKLCDKPFKALFDKSLAFVILTPTT